jgi:hypothetical protein
LASVVLTNGILVGSFSGLNDSSMLVSTPSGGTPPSSCSGL